MNLTIGEQERRRKISEWARATNLAERLNNHPNSIQSRFKIGDDSRRGDGRNFSKATREKLAARMSIMASQQIGEKHPLWKGGITSKHQKIRTGKIHHDWAMKVYARDGYNCHGITLCRSCHAKIHKFH